MPNFEDDHPTDRMPLSSDEELQRWARRAQASHEATKRTVDGMRRQIAALSAQAAGHDRGQLEILRRLDKQDEVMKESADSLAFLRDFLAAKRIGTGLLVWLGGLASSAMGVVGLWLWLRK